MVRYLSVGCDACQPGDRAPASIIDIAIRTTNPDPDAVQKPPVLGTLEICDLHGGSAVADVAKLVAAHGTPLTDEAAALITQQPPRQRLATDDMVCHTCNPPRSLRRGSLHGHAKSKHGGARPSQLDIRDADSPTD